MLYALSTALVFATSLCLGSRLNSENQSSGRSRSTAASRAFECKVDNDLIMVLDSSAYMKKAEFDEAKKFFADFADAFSSAPHNRLGFKVFAAQPQTIFELKTGLRPDQMEKFIVTAPYFGDAQKEPLFANSLADALTEFQNDNRTKVDQNFVLITAGKSGEAGNIGKVADQMTAAGVRPFAVGIGSEVDKDQLLTVAGGFKDNILTANDFDSLGAILDDLIKRVCSDKPPTCHMETDLMVALDNSALLYPEEYDSAKNFTAQLLEPFVMSDKNRVSFRIFSEYDLSIFKLDNSLTRAEIRNAVINAPLRQYFTFTDKTLDAGRAEFDELRRAKVPQNFLIITFVQSWLPHRTKAAAKRAYDAGIKTFVLGIGRYINKDELLTIANNDSDRVFTVADFDELREILSKLSAEICD